MKKDKVLLEVKVEPNKLPEVVEIENKLDVLQQAVGGYIEAVPMEDGVCLIVNEEGKMNHLPLNRALRDEEGKIWDITAGTFLVVGDDYSIGEFVSLTEEQAEFYKEKFHFSEFFYMMGNKIVAQKVPMGFDMGRVRGDDI